jgi:hypothetical protein
VASLIDQSGSELITSFQRNRNPHFKTAFILALIAFPVILLVLRQAANVETQVAVGIVAGIVVLLAGWTVLCDKAQLIEIYRDRMIIREGKNNADVEEAPWTDIEDIQAVYIAKQSAARSTAGDSLGGALGFFFLSQVAKDPTVPDELVLRFKSNGRKLKLDRTCYPVFIDLQRAAMDTWLAEASQQLTRGEFVRIGEWQLSQRGILTAKQMIPWAGVRTMAPYLEGVQLTYWDDEKRKEQQTYQKVDLRGELLGALKKQIQTV